MAKRRKKRKKRVAKTAPMSTGGQLVRVLATWMIHGMKPEEAAVRLSGIGLEASEISEMLLVNKNYVNVAKLRWKKKMKKQVRQENSD
jgi:hypothetical protein